jgi:ubiquitin-like 1-activating enzyme E1 A
MIDEAAVYDRQIRLWGLEAQQKCVPIGPFGESSSGCFYYFYDRMRNATILLVRVRGVATEVIKNIVLAGIGKLIIMDGDDVAEEDLGACFFFRDGDVGKKVGILTRWWEEPCGDSKLL